VSRLVVRGGAAQSIDICRCAASHVRCGDRALLYGFLCIAAPSVTRLLLTCATTLHGLCCRSRWSWLSQCLCSHPWPACLTRPSLALWQVGEDGLANSEAQNLYVHIHAELVVEGQCCWGAEGQFLMCRAKVKVASLISFTVLQPCLILAMSH
jgi:hypothetical protein